MDGGAVRAMLSTLCCQRGKRLLELEAPALSWMNKILMGVFNANISSYSIKYSLILDFWGLMMISILGSNKRPIL